MSLSRDDVLKVSLLARLRLNEAELETMTGQLAKIVDYVQVLNELDTSHVEPMAHALDVKNVFRDDATQASLPREQALLNAPKQDDECFLVPAVLGE